MEATRNRGIAARFSYQHRPFSQNWFRMLRNRFAPAVLVVLEKDVQTIADERAMQLSELSFHFRVKAGLSAKQNTVVASEYPRENGKHFLIIKKANAIVSVVPIHLNGRVFLCDSIIWLIYKLRLKLLLAVQDIDSLEITGYIKIKID